MTHDQEIYQTERWSDKDLTYKLPLSQEGKYVLILKWSEVYFNSPNEKLFDIAIGDTTVLSNVDVYTRVGKGTAYDEYIEFELRNNKVYIQVNLIFLI